MNSLTSFCSTVGLIEYLPKIKASKTMQKCTPQAIISEVPDVQTVVLPSNWFDDLNDGESVFQSLYNWMLNNDRIPSEGKESLHNRTYVGEILFEKLRAAEKKRLRRMHNLTGDNLERALNWSDMNSGPMTGQGESTIRGDVILVIPESSRQALTEFFFKSAEKKRKALISKTKDNAAGASFYRWLLAQLERPDLVGDIARDAEHDDEFPREGNQYEEIKFYLDFKRAHPAAIEALKESWLEYLEQYPERVEPHAWCSECGDRIEVKDALIVWDSESRDLSVLDKICFSKFMQVDEVKSRTLSGITDTDVEEFVEARQVDKRAAEVLMESLKLWGVIPIVTKGQIYFIRSEKTHEIKIGFTSGQVQKRISSLQTGHPYKLKLLATLPGNRDYEKSLHERFAAFRLEGEWFQPHPDLIAFISMIS